MELKVDEISKIIRQRIEGFESQTDLAEVVHTLKQIVCVKG